MMSLNLLQFLRPNSQISISAGIFEGIRSNNDARKGLSFFVGHCRIRVRRCMLRGDDNISQGAKMNGKCHIWVSACVALTST